jgi:hypothetical protein
MKSAKMKFELCISLRRNFLIYSLRLLVGIFFLTTSSFYAQEPGKTTEPAVPKTLGKVSHQFRGEGCFTVIIIKQPGNDIILIPKNPLPKKFDKNGLEIKFEYRLLRMPNPKGCEKGRPAEITNISKK